MNKYLLIVSAIAAFGGVSSVLPNAKSEFGLVGEFCDDMFNGHPKKLMFAGVLGTLSKAAGTGVLLTNKADQGWAKTINGISRRSFGRFTVPAVGIVTYSALKTAYDRSKK